MGKWLITLWQINSHRAKHSRTAKKSRLKENPPALIISQQSSVRLNWGVTNSLNGTNATLCQFSMRTLPRTLQIYREQYTRTKEKRRRAPIQKCLGGAKEGAWPRRNQSEQCGRINQRLVSVFGGAGDDRETKKKPQSRLAVNWEGDFRRRLTQIWFESKALVATSHSTTFWL